MSKGPLVSPDPPARLRRVRECLGLSQRDMAAELDVAHGAVGLWESGARPLPGPVLRLRGGPRRCLGAAFATYEMKLVLATVLRAHALRLTDRGDVRSALRNTTASPAKRIKMVRP